MVENIATADSKERAARHLEESAEPHIKQIWWQASLVLIFSAFCIYTGMGFEAGFDRLFPEEKAFYSVFNNRQSGWSALFEMARDAHFDCQAWEAPYRELKTLKGLLVIVQPNQPIEDAEFKQILEWVRNGNQLIYIDLFSFETARDLIKRLGVTVDEVTVTSAVFTPARQTRELLHVKKFVLSAKSVLHGGQALVKCGKDDEDSNLLTELKVGHGRVLLGTMPAICSNRQLDDERSWDGFQFMLNWFDSSEQLVLFDERCHGYSGSQNVFGYLLKSYPGMPLAQVALIFCLAVISAHQRFGQITTVKRKRSISNLEFVDGLAATYRRSGASALALSIIVSDFRNRISRFANVSPHAAEQELQAALAGGDEKTAKLGVKIRDFLTGANLLIAKKHISEQELCREVEALDALSEESAKVSGEARG